MLITSSRPQISSPVTPTPTTTNHDNEDHDDCDDIAASSADAHSARKRHYEALFETRGTEPPALPYHVLTQRFPDLVAAQLAASVAWCAKYGVPLNRANRRLPGVRA